MTLIKHHQVDKTLSGMDRASCPKIILICGEAFLSSKVYQGLTRFLLEEGQREFGLEALDGPTTPMGDIIEQATTFSFLSGPKVIAVKNAPLFSPAGEAGGISYGEKDLERLSGLIQEGLPENHFLVLLAQGMDRRKKIFKSIEKLGLVVDCSVPQGARKADLDEQAAVLGSITEQVMFKAGKTLDQNAFRALTDLTGFNLELFAGNLDKLVSYTGATPRITLGDVEKLIKRDKKDPIFLFTNAVLDRNLTQSLFFLSSLFKDRFHPLQILKSMENQIRKLLMIKSFTMDPKMQGMNPRQINFNSFKTRVMPAVIQRDEEIRQKLTQNASVFEPLDREDQEKKKKGKKNTPSTDLFLAPNPKNLYPVFQIFQKSENFTLEELKNGLIDLADLDHQFKTSASEERAGVENFIINLCKRSAPGRG
ncbi:DNA polymerase III subunit delta [Desulfospira joergensenii]|uniref:DNA polymerase III subunit delta n=1 Tax=Desulfospira joergensenii TaxID=53329 RepID=UPI0003B46821|nr:DNA polymerase III subunit delta [Desulfospira joergensenii]